MLLQLVVVVILLHLLVLLVLHMLLVGAVGGGLPSRPHVLLRPIVNRGSAIFKPTSLAPAASETAERWALRLSVACISTHWPVASVAEATDAKAPRPGATCAALLLLLGPRILGQC